MPAEPATATGRAAGLTACRECGLTVALTARRCPRCGEPPAAPDRRSLQAVWAFLIAGIVAYVPANLYPMLITRNFGLRREDTLIGGALDLLAGGAWFVGAIVFTASVVIPIGKFLAIAYLAESVRRGSVRGLARKKRLYEVIEFIGRWSMIDVFVVAVLAAVVQLGFLASIEAGPAAAPFALSVALTMLAAQRLDPRLLWAAEDGGAR